MKNNHIYIILLFIIAACAAEKEITINDDLPKSDNNAQIEEQLESPKEVHKIVLGEKDAVKLGIDVLQDQNFELLKEKRIGLITNQTGLNSDLKSTIDIFYENISVDLVALYGPEHGVRGDIEGGKIIDFYTDERTNLPVHSLYGRNRRPSAEILEGIDALVYDIQDIGVRSYTYISTMGLAIEAASKNNIEFIILDRPNPLGGIKVEGNLVEDEYISFISKFKIPYIYGLTCGELAKLLVGEGMIKTSTKFKLTIVPMKNWERSMQWVDTGLEWVPTSPHIPYSFTSFYYPMTGILGELRSSISVGVGYTLPFQLVGAEWINPNDFIDVLKNMNIPGINFRPLIYKPFYAFGKERTIRGIQLYISDYDKINLIKTQFYLMCALKNLYPEMDLLEMATPNELSMFNKAIGSKKVYEILKKALPLNTLFEFLDKDIQTFKILSSNYYLY